MSPALEICMLGASSLKDGSPRWQCSVPIGNDNDDVLPFGECAVMQALGVTARPYPKDNAGHAEAIVAPGVGNRKGVVIGARDTRDADIVGKIDEGDTVIHATGPGKKPQIQVKKKKQSAAIVVPCADGKDAVVIVDGKNHRIQILAFGQCFQMSKTDGITINDGKGGGLQIAGGEVTILGTLRLPGLKAGMFLYSAPVTGPISGAPASPVTGGFPVMGVGGTG